MNPVANALSFLSLRSAKNKALLIISSVWTHLENQMKFFFWRCIMFNFQFHPVSSKLLQIERNGQSESVKNQWVAPQCQVQNTRNLRAGSSPLQLSAAWTVATHPSRIPHPKSTAVLMDQLDQMLTASPAGSEETLHQLKMSPAGKSHCLHE